MHPNACMPIACIRLGSRSAGTNSCGPHLGALPGRKEGCRQAGCASSHNGHMLLLGLLLGTGLGTAGTCGGQAAQPSRRSLQPQVHAGRPAAHADDAPHACFQWLLTCLNRGLDAKCGRATPVQTLAKKFLRSTSMLGHRTAHVLQRVQLAPRLFSGIRARASSTSPMAEPVKVSANCGQLPVGVSASPGPCCSFAARVRLHARTRAVAALVQRVHLLLPPACRSSLSTAGPEATARATAPSRWVSWDQRDGHVQPSARHSFSCQALMRELTACMLRRLRCAGGTQMSPG